MRTQTILRFVGLIYDTALDPGAWPTLLDQLADLLGASGGAHIGSYNAETNLSVNLAPRLDPEYLRSLTEYWASRNVVWQRSSKHPIGAVMTPDMFIGWDEYKRTDIFNEWFKPQGLEAVMGTNLLVEGPVSTVVSVGRPFAEGDFGQAERRLFAALTPHLQRSVQLHLRLADLGTQPTASTELLNRLRQGVLLVDAGARVLFANRAAEAMFHAGAGLSIDLNGLRTEAAVDTDLLRQCIAACAGRQTELGGTGGRMRLSREHRAPLTVLVIPHRTQLTWLDIVRPAAILFITDPERDGAGDVEDLRHDFGLTPAEAAFTLEIVKGDGLQAVARRLGTSVTTARTHLSRVFYKTGTQRQAELVRLIMQSQRRIIE
jgi:DNA-binding CsgD family transcriptional regulator